MRAPPPPCGCVGVRRARVHVPRRVPPRGARQKSPSSHVSCCRVPRVRFLNHTWRMFGAPLRAPRGALPLPMRRSARPQGGAALPPPLGAGVRFIPSGCSHAAPPASPHSAAGFARVPRFAPAASGERSAFAPRFAPRFAWFFHFLAAFAAAVRRRRRGGVTPRHRRARSPCRWRASVCRHSCPVSFLPFGNVPAA